MKFVHPSIYSFLFPVAVGALTLASPVYGEVTYLRTGTILEPVMHINGTHVLSNLVQNEANQYDEFLYSVRFLRDSARKITSPLILGFTTEAYYGTFQLFDTGLTGHIGVEKPEYRSCHFIRVVQDNGNATTYVLASEADNTATPKNISFYLLPVTNQQRAGLVQDVCHRRGGHTAVPKKIKDIVPDAKPFHSEDIVAEQ